MLILGRKESEGVSIGTNIRLMVNKIGLNSVRLELEVEPEQEIRIGDNVLLKIVQLEADQVKIGINAPKWIEILRNELLERCQARGFKSRPELF